MDKDKTMCPMPMDLMCNNCPWWDVDVCTANPEYFIPHWLQLINDKLERIAKVMEGGYA